MLKRIFEKLIYTDKIERIEICFSNSANTINLYFLKLYFLENPFSRHDSRHVAIERRCTI